MPSHFSTTFPAPSPEALDHCERLAEFIRHDITAHDGWISFERFMELALYSPGLGYYTAGAHKFGPAGDFITAPELSSLFGRTLSRQVAEIMEQSDPHILELGAGSGKLAVDMLERLEQLGCLPNRYSILEVSADLRERQKALISERLPNLINRIQWLDALPESINGVIVANEVLDALPVHLVHWHDSGISERGVSLEGINFAWREQPISNASLLQAAQNIKVPNDYMSEICLAARGLVHSLAQRLEQGALLFIDYGFGAREFYHPQRSSGTLMCHYRHYAHSDPFLFPGLQDITAHVNFTDIAESAIDAGLDLAGYTSQAHFLINCGITDLLKDTSPDELREYLPLSSQIQKLTSPAEMGELFKVMALGKNITTPLCGFVHGELIRSL